MNDNDNKLNDNRWYKDGIHFTCTQCGNCCTGPPGYVWFNDDEADAMAKILSLSTKQFKQRFARKIGGRWSLNELKTPQGKYDCVFLRFDVNENATCDVYNARPAQCRTWPFWFENVSSIKAWRKAAQTCPAMAESLKNQGNLFTIQQIDARLKLSL